MNQRVTWKRNAQFVVVLLCALTLKLYYSTADVNRLRWILAPTTVLVELVSGSRFAFESHAGYISSDHSFIIAASCAGVNFLIIAFLMLSLSRLWTARSPNQSRDTSSNPSVSPSHNPSVKVAWRFIPVAVLSAYLATLVANSVRISTALWLRSMPVRISWLSENQLHRLEGIFIYFGFLILLFVVSEKMDVRTGSRPGSPSGQPRWGGGGDRVSIASEEPSGLFRQSFFPLLIYYATTLGIPLANGAYHRGSDFCQHSLFVLLTPLLLILPLAAFRFFRHRRAPVISNVGANSGATSTDLC